MAKPYRISGTNGKKGDCMEPAIQDGKLYFVNYLYYKFNDYKAGDIVVFRYEEKEWISRIVGLGGQNLQIIDSAILINNNIYNDFVQRNWKDWKYGHYGVDSAVKIPANHVYVLSDNLSAHHDDSRVFGPISYDSILGKVW